MRLLKNPVAMVITIGVCIIPSLYAWYNIAANWDPYGSTAGVKIAVANEDEGTSNELVGELNAGEQTVGELKKNHDLGWVFTDAERAQEGVRRGDYYAAIVIPKDFSKDLTSMLTGEFEQPKISYYVNEKKNAIAPKVTDTGAETIEEQINETFVSTVSKTLATQAKALGVDLKAQAGEAKSGLLAHIRSSKDAVTTVRTSLGGMDETIAATKKAVGGAQSTLSQLDGQIPSLIKALTQADTLMGTTRAAARDFSTSLSTALTGGATQLGAASAKANAAVGTVSGVVSEAKLKADIALSNLQSIIDSNTKVIELLKQLNGSGHITGELDSLIAGLEEQNANMQGLKNGLQAQSDAVGQDMNAVEGAVGAVNTAVQGSVDGINGVHEQMSTTVLPQISTGLDAFSGVASDLSGVAAGAQPTIEQSAGILSQLNGMLDQTSTALDATDKVLGDIESMLDTAATDVAALRSSESMQELAAALNMDADEVAEFMASPALLTTKAVYPVVNYGSGVTPFYTNLALWVGGFVLIAIFKLEVDREGIGHITAIEGYFGRWLLLVLLGFVQALIVCVGDLALGIQCEQSALFVLAGLFTSFVYVNIIYALAITFKHIGKAIGVILVIVQIPGSSGMYPIEMMPAFFQGLHPLLPFTYGINAMRETIGGMYGADYLVNLGVLAIFLGLALILGVWLRPLLLNLNLLFDHELSGTDVMICEKDDMPRERFSMRATIRALLDTQAFRRDILERGARFERRYPRLIKIGFALVFGLPILLFILTATLDLDIDGKLTMLVLWIVAIIAADAYMIVVEYMRESLNVQARMTALSDEELHDQIERAFPVARQKGGEE
ncbi:MAG: YhgE/Pip domain-containing protein [Coriobacteriaceae bacterium]|nr:YhgE/Pip domain-containing protein [Coriobacteriaceae bacterium]